MIIGVIICYAFGTVWFAFVYAKTNTPASIGTILTWCVLPFLLPDAVKIILAATLTSRLKKHIKH